MSWKKLEDFANEILAQLPETSLVADLILETWFLCPFH